MFRFISNEPKELTLWELYTYAKQNNKTLFSDSTAVYWQTYINNHFVLDSFYANMFKSYRPFFQTINEATNAYEVAEVFTQFKSMCDAVLLLNDKRYNELYRLNVLPAYDMTKDTNILLSRDFNTRTTGTYTEGSRNDSTDISNTINSTSQNTINTGAGTATTTKTVAGFNSTGFDNYDKNTAEYGARIDSSNASDLTTNNSDTTHIKGSQINSTDENIVNEFNETKSGNNGARTIPQILQEHKLLWVDFEFYTTIFTDIAKQLLLV